MPKMVYNNVVGHRLIDNGTVLEDITSVSLPTIEHPTSTIAVSGMAGDLDVPNNAHVNAMEFSVSHNKGIGCRYLANPGKHSIELRIARQKYNVAESENEYEQVKIRVIGTHKSSENGNVETGNPYGGTDKFSVIRFEEEIDGEIVTLIDVTAGIIRHNGIDCTSPVESLLN